MLVKGVLGEVVVIARNSCQFGHGACGCLEPVTIGAGEHVAEEQAMGSGGASLVGRITALEVGAARVGLCQRD
jgi:hypothetical protein